MDNNRRKTLGARFKKAGSTGTKTHVMSRQGRWVIFKEGADKVIAQYPTKKIAITNARRHLKFGDSEMLVLHKQDGSVEKIQESY